MTSNSGPMRENSPAGLSRGNPIRVLKLVKAADGGATGEVSKENKGISMNGATRLTAADSNK